LRRTAIFWANNNSRGGLLIFMFFVRCRTARLDLGERGPARLVATAEDRLKLLAFYQ
jgi:hypothetical protein